MFEVRRNGRVTPVGENRAPQAMEKVPRARAALAEAVAAGLFVRKGRTTFVFARHYAGVEAMLAYNRERDPEVTLDEEMIARARTLLAAGEGRLISRAQVHAERLRRMEPSGSKNRRER